MAKRPEPYQQNGAGPYWVRWMIDGVRTKIGLRTLDRVEAFRLANDLYDRAVAEATLVRLSQGKMIGKSKNMPLDMAIGTFWKDHVVEEKLKGQEDIKRRLGVLNEVIGPETMVTDVDDDRIKAFKRTRSSMISKRTKRLLSPVSVNGELAELQRLLAYTRDALKVPGMPVIDWRRIKTPDAKLPKRTRIIRPSEVCLILGAIGSDYRPLVELAFATGLRLDGFTGRTWRDVDWHTRTLRYIGKGGAYDTIHLTSEIEAILQKEDQHRASEDAAIFTFQPRGKSRPRRPVTYWGFTNQWRKALAKLDIPHAMPHDMRRTYVTDFYDSTNDLVAASKAAGHSSTRVTEAVYLHLPPRHVREATEKAAQDRMAKRRALA